MSAQLGHAHGLPKIYNAFTQIWIFASLLTQPIRHTKNIVNMSSVSQTISINNCTLKDSFDGQQNQNPDHQIYLKNDLVFIILCSVFIYKYLPQESHQYYFSLNYLAKAPKKIKEKNSEKHF